MTAAMPARRPDERVEPHGVALDVDAREARGLAVAADRDRAAAERRAVEQHPAERGDDREDPDQDVDADEVGVHEADEVRGLRRLSVRRSARISASPRAATSIARVAMNATTLPYAITTPLIKPAPSADRERDHDHDDPVRLVGEVLDRRQGRHDRGETHDRADRQVDAARDDDEGHADADDADDRCLAEDRQRRC